MKFAQLESTDAKGNPIALEQAILLLEPWETEVLHAAVEQYCKDNPRKKKAKRLLRELSDATVFW